MPQIIFVPEKSRNILANSITLSSECTHTKDYIFEIRSMQANCGFLASLEYMCNNRKSISQKNVTIADPAIAVPVIVMQMNSLSVSY